jgi:hypothetical protein
MNCCGLFKLLAVVNDATINFLISKRLSLKEFGQVKKQVPEGKSYCSTATGSNHKCLRSKIN